MWNRRWSPSPRLVLAMLAATCTLGGCVAKSLAPVVGEKESEFDARLVGTWQGEGKESAVVTASGRDYLVVYTDDQGQPSRFVGRLGKLGARRALDLSPEIGGSDSYQDLILPLHTVLIIDSLGTEIRAHAIHSDSLEAYLEREPTAIAHVKAGDGVVLTAPTPEVRSFLERFAARPGVLDSATWKRR